jgi:hypothetical protein
MSQGAEMTLIAELKYVAEWAQHHQDKAEVIKKAADAIQTLQAENERLELALEVACRKSEAIAAKLATLEAEAERYRWLRENCSYSYGMQPDSPAEHGIEYRWQQGTYEERNHGIDTTIDAAIDAAKGGQ